jgi:MFS family permease
VVEPVEQSDTVVVRQSSPDGALSPGAAKALVFFASGAVLVLEILAGRLMAPYVGVSLETFTGIIGTMLAGIAVGATVGGRMADRTPPRTLLGPALVIGGALSWLSLPILSALGPNVSSDPVSIVALTCFAFLAPATVLSAVSPMVAKLQLSNLDQTGSVIGSLSAAGTTGAIFATFFTGFVLAAALPSRPTVLALGALLVIVGVWLWFRLGTTRPRGLGVVFLLGAFGLGASSPTPCEHETAYACATVLADADRPSGRSLVLDDLRHSYVDLDDPTYLDFRYFRLFADVVDAIGSGGSRPVGALDVLNIGGAGFAFPRYIEATRPGTSSLVLEIDGEVVKIAEAELGLELDDDLQVIVGDARLALDDLEPAAYDLVIGDAFGGRSVPWHLTTTEVIAQIETLLRADGIYIMNVIDGGDSNYARAQLATLTEHFTNVQVIIPPGGVPSNRAANQILIASNTVLPTLDVDSADGQLLSQSATADFIDGAQVLRDDFAPVDQLAKNF